LLGGSAAILLIGYLVLHVDQVAGAMISEGGAGIAEGLRQLAQAGDLGLWLYLIFAISNAMLPSESDMEAVRPVLIFLGLVAAVVLLVAGVPTIPDAIVQGVNVLAGYLASAFGLTLAVDLVFIVVILLLLWLTRWIRGK
jgi:hypothetical protein